MGVPGRRAVQAYDELGGDGGRIDVDREGGNRAEAVATVLKASALPATSESLPPRSLVVERTVPAAWSGARHDEGADRQAG